MNVNTEPSKPLMPNSLLPDYDLIIFDCDGTLVNSHDMNHSIMAEIANQYGGLSYSLESVEKEYLGIDYAKFFKMVSAKENIDIPDDAANQCVAMVYERIPTMMKKIDGTYEALERLAPYYKLNVASNANLKIVQDSLRATGLDQFFDLDKIMAGRAMATPKPAPDLFLAAAQNMNVAPQKCLVIEDSPTGVQAGVAAGMEVWGFTGAAREPELTSKALKSAGVSRVFSSFIHIADGLRD